MPHDSEAILNGEIESLEKQLANCANLERAERLKLYLEFVRAIQKHLFPPAPVAKVMTEDELIAKLDAAAEIAEVDRSES